MDNDTIYNASISITVDDSTLKPSLNKIKTEIESSLEDSKKSTASLSKEFANLGKKISAIMGGAGEGFDSVSSSATEMEKSIKAAMDNSNRSTKQLSDNIVKLENNIKAVNQNASTVSLSTNTPKQSAPVSPTSVSTNSKISSELSSAEKETDVLTRKMSECKTAIDSTMSSGSKGSRQLSDSLADIATKAGLAYAAFKGLGAVGDVFGGLVDSYNSYEAAMNGVKAVASATGESVAGSMQVIKDSTANGLLNQADAAAAVKNLELYGYSAEQAGEMIRVLTDAAAYNRQSNYDLSEAVRVTTEGIRMENSVLSDAAGVQKNIAKMQEDYARSIGKTTDKLTQAEKAQAVYNGVMAEAGIFEGNAAQYADSLAGAQSKLNGQIETLKQNLGGVVAQAISPLVNGLADWLTKNQALAGGIAAFVGVIAGGTGLLVALSAAKKAISSIRSTIMAMSLVTRAATGGFLALAAGAAAIGTAMVISDQLNKTAIATEEVADSSSDASIQLDNMSTSAQSSAKQLAKLEKQLEDLKRDYDRDLKQIAVKHQENLDSLTQQIEEANIDYRRAIDERMADFNVTLAKQERSHQETVDELMTQLNFLQRYNNDYNKQKLTDVQFALAKEEELYKRKTEAQKTEIALQNQADKAKLDAKLESLQNELNDEVEFMNKHRDILQSVRDVILEDEVESLTRRYNENVASMEEQKQEIIRIAAETANAVQEKMDKAQQSTEKVIQTLNAVYNKTRDTLEVDLTKNNGITTIVRDGEIIQTDSRGKMLSKQKAYGSFKSGFSSGGYTGPGPKDEVAGVVHRGEYVVPKEDVDQSTGLPKNSGTITQTFVFNLSGVLATSQQAKRELAEELKRAFDQTNQARLA